MDQLVIYDTLATYLPLSKNGHFPSNETITVDASGPENLVILHWVLSGKKFSFAGHPEQMRVKALALVSDSTNWGIARFEVTPTEDTPTFLAHEAVSIAQCLEMACKFVEAVQSDNIVRSDYSQFEKTP